MKKENFLLIIALSTGIITSALIAPKDKFFWGNFIYYWGPQALVFLLIIVIRFKIGILTGAAFVFGIYLVLFHSWLFSLPRPEPLLWLLYVFSFIGGGIGVLIAGIISKKYSSLTNMQNIMTSAIISATGIALNLFILNLIFV